MRQKNFNEMCIELRERAQLSSKELAKQADMSVTQVYHAEGRRSKGTHTRRISASSLRTIYFKLCKNQGEYMELLSLWAIDQDGKKLDPKSFLETLQKKKKVKDTKTNDRHLQLLKNYEALSHKDRDYLLKVSEQLMKNPPFRDLIVAWFKGIKPTEN